MESRKELLKVYHRPQLKDHFLVLESLKYVEELYAQAKEDDSNTTARLRNLMLL